MNQPSPTPPLDGSTPTAKPSSSLVGCRFDEYQVLRKLGHGGMADVYAAQHLNLGRNVAMKVLRDEFARDAAYVQRFRREARAAAKLNHPNIVQVYDVKSVDDRHFITQELIEGQNLREYLTQQGTLDEPEAIAVLLAVGEALDNAAEAGITHRDIKPENIMRSSRGEFKVADFGLARMGPEPGKSHAELTQAGLTLGTPRYMSPEQIQGRAVDSRSDLYSLGITMYHLLAGRPPFEADDPLALAVMHVHETPEPLDQARGRSDLPEWLIAVISRLINKLPEDRFQSPAELVSAVRSQTSLAETKIEAGVAAVTTRLQRVTAQADRQRNLKRMRWTAFACLPVLTALLAGWLASQRPAVTVGGLLNPKEVEKFDSVQAQWLEAVRRKSPDGWMAVVEYFPPTENAVNREYANKAKLQLARHYLAEQPREAQRVLDSMLRDPDVSGIYRAAAMIRRYQVAVHLEQEDQVAKYRQLIDNEIKALRTEDPDAIPTLTYAFGEETLVDVGIVPEDS